MKRIQVSKEVIATALGVAAAMSAVGIWTLGPPKPGAPTRKARKIVAALRAFPSSPLRLEPSEEPRTGETTPAPDVSTPTDHAAVLVILPGWSTKPLHVQDGKTGLGVDVQVRDVFNVAAQSADGYFVYPHAHASGGTLLHRETEDGVEDFISFETRPAKPEVAYEVTLKGVRSVRLVQNTLELLDGSGVPRLRAAPPFIVGADGERTDATVAVENCAVDTNPAAPWGRDLTPPGSDSCTLRVRWSDEQVRYPAVLDPRWQSTGSMTSARQDFTTTMMSTGKVLAVGGRASGTSTTGMSTAEIFDPATNTWATTTSIGGGRYFHTATQLGTTSSGTTSGEVFVAGGTTAGASLNTAQLYSPTTGLWRAATNLNVARHGATATLLSNGNVLLAGGLSGTVVQNTAAIYNPSSGAGTFTATGTMPQAVKFHSAILLKVPGNSTLNNKVMIVGGNSGTASVTNVQLFDGTTNWSSLTALSSSREGHTATALANGNVLIAGGRSGTSTLNTTLLFNAASGSGSWSSAGTLTTARQLHAAVLLPSAIVEPGQVLLAGGNSGSSTLGSAEVWNGTTTWTATASLPSVLQGETATLLNNNLVLFAGGSNGSSTVATSVTFDGSFALQCTSNSQCATGFCVNGVCCDTACNGGCGACNLTGKVGTCSPIASGTVCRAATDQCDQAGLCSGSSTTCPADSKKPNGTGCNDGNACTQTDTCQAGACVGGNPVTCTPQGQCRAAGTCDTSTGACSNPTAPDGTTCNDGDPQTAVDTCRSGACVGTGDPAAVLGFEDLGQWSFSTGGTVVGLNDNHTQGSHSLEVAAQNYQPLVSLPMATIGNVGPVVLLDVLLPTNQANPFSYGDIQMFVNAPSVGIFNQYMGIVGLTGLPLATWQTLAFQLTSQQVAALGGSYDDLTFTIAINVPFNETGHYLLDNLRFDPGIFPSVLGIAQNSAGVTEAVFTYQTSTPATIPYGPANALSDQNGFISAPLDLPPQQFVTTNPTPFVATLAGSELTWTVTGNSATATLSSTQLPTTTGPNGTKVAILPNGTQVNLDGNSGVPSNAILPSDTSYTTFDKNQDAVNASNAGEPNIGPTSPGTLPGTFQVANDGSAQYTIPLETPHGRNGIEPHLALVYNSRAGSGNLGPGWALQGLHRITRCKRTYGVGQELGTDPQPVTYTNGDELCLDGERLVPIVGSTGEYRTKMDQQAKIIVTASDSDGPLSFSIYRKDGTIESYGLDSSTRGTHSRIGSINGSAPGDTTFSFTQITREWMEGKVVDRFGNTMTITYQLLPMILATALDGLQAVPGTISYTSNPNTGRSATNTVSFSYTPLGKAVVKLESGVLVAGSGNVLSEIDVKAPNPAAPSLVTSYKMTYETPSITGRPLLRRVQRCGSDGVCMAPTIFSWAPGSYQFRRADSGITNFHPSTQNYGGCALLAEGGTRILVAGDFDGDGKGDLLYRQNLPTSTTCDNEVSDAINAGLQLAFSAGINGFESLMNAGITNEDTIFKTGDPFDNTQFFSTPSNEVNSPIIVDLTGDGKSDVIMTLDQQIAGAFDLRRYDIYQGQGRGPLLTLPAGLTFNQLSDTTLNPLETQNQQDFGSIVVGDFNGDGLMDIARQMEFAGNPPFGLLGARFSLPGGLGTSYQTNVSPQNNVLWGTFSFPGGDAIANEIFASDLDGDGRTEIVMSTINNTTVAVRGTGVGAGCQQPNCLQIVPTNIPPSSVPRLSLDVNGDGLRDVILGTTLWINTGNGFLPVSTVDSSLSSGLVGDLNGDGMDDILVPGCSSNANGPQAQAFISGGDGSFVGQTLPIPSGLSINGNCSHVLVDVDGDGQLDYVQPEAGTDQLQIYYRIAAAPDRIFAFINGVRAITTVEYLGYAGAGSDACAYPQSCAARNVSVVSSYSVDEGQVEPTQDKTTQYSMTYSGVTADAQGAGWVGFTKITQTNERTNATDVKTFDLATRIGDWFPFAGLPQTETFSVTLQATGTVMTRQKATIYKTIQSDPNNPLGSFSVVPQVVDTTETEQVPGQPAASPQRSTQEVYTYDDFANVTNYQIMHTIDGSSENRTYAITNDATNWLIGQVGSVTDVSSTALNGSDTRSTTYQIDSTTGAVMGTTVEPGDPVEQLVTTYLRNGDGLIYSTSATPASGSPRTTLVAYDNIDGAWPAAYTNALGQVTRVAYHCGLGVLTTMADLNGATTQWQYDTLGKTRGTADPSGEGTSIHYSRPDATSTGVIASWSDTAGRTGQTVSDELLREVSNSETAFDGSHRLTSTRSYDAVSGRIGSLSQPFGANGGALNGNATWTFTYDEVGRVTVSAPPNGAVHNVAYAGLKTTEFVGGTEKGYTVTDELNRVVLSSQIEPTSPSPNHEIQTSLDYGPYGTLKHVQAPNGATTTMSYDHLANRTEVVDPDSGDRSATFNSFGELVGEQLPGQTALAYGRDPLGRETSIEQGTELTSFNFDTATNGIGKLESQVSPSGVTITFAYQPSGVPQATTYTVNGNQYRFDWTYSTSGRLSQIAYPTSSGSSRFAITVGYGGDGRVGSLLASNTGESLWQKSSVSDDGHLFEELFGDGLSAIHDHDPLSGRLTHLSTGSGAVVPEADGGDTFQNRLQSLGYSYYPDGTMQSRTDFALGATEGFSYDNLSRVKTWSSSVSEDQVQYGYDDSGNLTSRSDTNPGGSTLESYRYGERGAGPHALTTGPAGTYSYDQSGRQISNPGAPTLTYTYFDLPAAIQTSGGSINFAYDALGKRVEKKTSTADSVTVGGLYERRVTSSGAVNVFYLPGDATMVGEVLCTDDGNCAAPIFFHPDQLGTIDTATSGGGVVGREKRDPFGRPYSVVNMSGPDQDVALGFIGEMEDEETNLVNLNHRLYDPRTGRFLSPDPLVRNFSNGQDYNRYSYAENNPLSFVDPSGLQSDGPPADTTPPPDTTVDPADVPFLLAQPTTDADGVTTRYTTFDPSLVPGGVDMNGFPGDPTGPYQGLQTTGSGPAVPNFGSPFSPSQSFVGDLNIAIGGMVGGSQGTPLSYTLLTAAPAGRTTQQRDWLTGRPGVVSIPIIIGGMDGFPGLGSKVLSLGARLALEARVALALLGGAAAQAEARVASEFGEELVAFNRPIFDALGNKAGEIDVELENAIIEVTVGKGGDKPAQVAKYLTTLFNPSGKPVFLFAPNMEERWVSDIPQGVTLVRSIGQLDALLHPENYPVY